MTAVQTVKLAKLLALYKPNIGRGNFQADVANRGANEMLVRVSVALTIAPEDRIRAEFRRLDTEQSERQQAYIDRLEAEHG